MNNEEKKQPVRIDGTLKEMITRMYRTGGNVERAKLILLDFICHMASKSYYFARLKGIAEDLAKAGATYTISPRAGMCGKKGCKKCPHNTYYVVYYRVQQKQSSRYLGKPLW